MIRGGHNSDIETAWCASAKKPVFSSAQEALVHVAEHSLTISFSLKIAGVVQEALLSCRASDGAEARRTEAPRSRVA